MGVVRNGWQESMHGWTRWTQKETLRRENWKFGRRRDSSWRQSHSVGVVVVLLSVFPTYGGV